MTIHNSNLTRAAAALLASGATFHVKDAGDPMATLRKAFGDHNAEVLKKLGASDIFMREISARLTEVEQKAVRDSGGYYPAAETWGAQFARNPEVKAIGSNWRGRLRVDVKATITSATTDTDGAAGDMLVPTRPAGAIELVRRKPRMRQLFSTGRTSSNAIQWPKMTGRTVGAETQTEGATKGQSDVKFDLITWPVQTIAHFMVASKQILDDVPGLQSIIDTELRDGLAEVEDAQLLNGGGTGTDLTGVYTNATAFAAPFDVVDITLIDVLLQAIAQCDALNYETDGIVLNPLDWRLIQAIKDTTGRYIGGGPFGELLARLWQMPIVTTSAMTQDKFLVGAFRQGAQIFDRQEATVEVSTEDSDNFRKNLVTVRGEERLAFVIKHQDAFIKGDFSDAMSL